VVRPARYGCPSGIHGNKKIGLDIEAVEFGATVVRLVGPGNEWEGFRMPAKAVGEGV
jgi:hypothetical protein